LQAYLGHRNIQHTVVTPSFHQLGSGTSGGKVPSRDDAQHCAERTAMARVTEVFTPSDVPSYTYVERPTHKLEQTLKQAFDVPKMIISISGPSKSGKTVLVNKVIEKDNLIHLSGSTIRSADELWAHTLQWMDVPTATVQTRATSVEAGVEVHGEGKLGIPLVAGATAGGKGSLEHGTSNELSKTFAGGGLQQVVREIGGSNFVLFLDDFHYIPKEVQIEIGKQVKAAAEAGVRICTASVPHRKDDVVRSNPELRGRVTGIDSDYWNESELAEIALKGFAELKMDVSPNIIQRFAREAFGSPQLMQAICLNACFEKKVIESLPKLHRFELNFVDVQCIFERTSTLTNFSSMIEQLHKGPRQRGVERKEYRFGDGTKGDVYRCVLLAMKADPPRLSFKYDDMLRRVEAVCKGDQPSGSSVNQALEQMTTIAKLVQEAPVLEWGEDVLDIIEPYFLFFLRSSAYLQSLA
jgi:hypothetical protein